MKNFIFTLSVLILWGSCDNSKSYKYIQICEDEAVGSGKKTIEEKAEPLNSLNDSTAYYDALSRFHIAVKVYGDMKNSGVNYTKTPLKFRVLNTKNEDITLRWVGLNKALEDTIIKRILTLPNQSTRLKSALLTSVVDSVKVNALKAYFRVDKDEFSKNNRTIYKPKSAPEYINRNGVYCYFSTGNDEPSNLKFCVQYHAEEWLFFHTVQFSIDGKAYEYTPVKTETDHGNGGHIWEWFDDGMTTTSDKELINALANAKSAKMKLVGRQYHKVKEVTSEQILAIKRTLEFYKAKGGVF